MPGVMEASQVGQLQEISDVVTNIRADEMPFISMCKKSKKPHQKIATWQNEDYRNGSIEGVMDNEDVQSFNSQPRVLLTGVCQKSREPWSVSDFAAETDVAGLPKGEKARQKAVAAIVLKMMMEGRALSNEECSVDNGVDTPNETRGVFKWIQAAAQALYPVDASFRPAAAVIYSGTLANLTETSFTAQLAAAFKARRGKLNLDGFVGIDLKVKFDDFTARDAEATATNVPVRQWTQNAKQKRFIKVVDFLELSTGTVRLHPSTYLYKNTNGSDSAYTHKSGAFLNMDMWELGFLGNRRPRMMELPDLGGGPRGYSDAIYIIKCLNTLGQVMVLSNA